MSDVAKLEAGLIEQAQLPHGISEAQPLFVPASLYKTLLGLPEYEAALKMRLIVETPIIPCGEPS